MPNSQDIEKRDYRNDGSLDVQELFPTVQGEGPKVGVPSIFVRLAGCNLQCPGCDTDYTSKRRRLSMWALRDEIVTMREDEFPASVNPLIVITGGEPFRQNITPLCHALLARGYEIQIETNGTLPPDAHLDRAVMIVVSPKTGKIHEAFKPRISALKYVVRDGCVDRRDGLPIRALDHTCSPTVAKPFEGYKGPIYINPMDEANPHANRLNYKAAYTACMQHGHTLGVQMHKIIGVD